MSYILYCFVLFIVPLVIFRLDVTNDTVSAFLEDFSLDEALEKKKIFKCDLEILHGLECEDDRIVSMRSNRVNIYCK